MSRLDTPRPPTGRAGRAGQHGAATLIVVMLLFFLTLLVSAYSARTLIFEQRTSANQYRASQAYEVAQGGLEWVVAMLNSPRPLTTECRPSNDVNAPSFRELLLTTNLDANRVVPTVGAQLRVAGCARGGNGWQCTCPLAGEAQLGTGNVIGGAFVVRLPTVMPTDPPGPLTVRVEACTSANDNRCFDSGSLDRDASARQSVQVALLPALRNLPTAALTLTGSAPVVPPGLRIVNTTPGVEALTLRTRYGLNAQVPAGALVTAPGTPADESKLVPDPVLENIGYTELFPLYTGIKQQTYRRMPGLTTLGCGGSCGTEVANAIAQGAQLLYAPSDLTLPGSTTLGSDTRPVVLVVDGRLTLQPSTRITGFVVVKDGFVWQGATANDWIRGAVQVNGSDFGSQITGTPTIVYDRSVLQRLQLTAGAFVRVPGSWIDR